MKPLRHGITTIFLLLCAFHADTANAQQASTGLETRTVVLIISDGLRRQEIFTGADRELLTTERGGNWAKPAYLQKTWWRDTPEDRRKALFPFIWSAIAEHVQIFGNQNKGSIARVTNPFAFSYPGYNEILTGAADPRIDSNEFGPNPNPTVFEWLNNQPAFHNKVDIFGTWETFADIFNQKRSHLPMHIGWSTPYPSRNTSPREQLLNELYRNITKLDDEDVYDSFLQVTLLASENPPSPRTFCRLRRDR